MSFLPVPGVRGGARLYTYGDGYYYKLNNKRHGSAHYQCYRKLCNARLYSAHSTENPKKNKNFPDHNHESEPRLAAVFNLRETIRARIINEGQNPRKIFEEECAKVPKEVSSSLNYNKMESTFHKVLRKAVPKSPKSTEEFNYFLSSSSRFNRTVNRKEFYRGNITSIGGNSNFVFLSENFIKMLSKSKELQLAIMPKRLFPRVPGVRYLLVIMAVVCDYAFPVCFVLMSEMTVESFKAIFQLLRRTVPTLEPIKIICDFEPCIREAVWEEFPKSEAHFSWWHYSNCILEKFVSSGLNDAFRNPQSTTLILKCMSLPFLPASLIKGGVDLIRQIALEINEDLGPVLGYIDQLIEDIGADQISACSSPEKTRTDFEYLEKDFMSGGMSKPKSGHPTIWNFIEKMQKIEDHFFKIHSMMERGGSIGCRKKMEGRKLLSNDRVIRSAIEEIIKDPSRTSVEEFLDTVCSQISKYKGLPTVEVNIREEDGEEEEIWERRKEESGEEDLEGEAFFLEVSDLTFPTGDENKKKKNQSKEKMCPELTLMTSSSQEWQPVEIMSCTAESLSTESMLNLTGILENGGEVIEDDVLTDLYEDSDQYTLQPDQNRPRTAESVVSSCNSRSKVEKRLSRPRLAKSSLMKKLGLEEKMVRLEGRKIQPISNIQRKPKQKSEDGDDYHFFMSLIPFMKPLPPVKKLMIRGKIQSLVMDAYSEYENQNKDGQAD